MEEEMIPLGGSLLEAIISNRLLCVGGSSTAALAISLFQCSSPITMLCALPVGVYGVVSAIIASLLAIVLSSLNSRDLMPYFDGVKDIMYNSIKDILQALKTGAKDFLSL